MKLVSRALILTLLLTGIISTTSFVAAQELFPQEICNSDPAQGPVTNNSAVCEEAENQVARGQDPVSGENGIISNAINIIASIAGAAAVIIIVYSGFVFATSGGSISGQNNPPRAQKARSTLLGAVIGLVIIALAWTITRFIIDRVL